MGISKTTATREIQMQTTAPAAQALQNIAYLTSAIQTEELRVKWDNVKLTSLYAARLTEVNDALKLGIPSLRISNITGLGA
jgi:hypothetical protein